MLKLTSLLLILSVAAQGASSDITANNIKARTALILEEPDAGQSNVTIKAHSTPTQTYTVILPPAQCANGEVWINDGSGNFSCGSGVPSFTQGSVIFAGASGLAQDNDNLFWNNTDNNLNIMDPNGNGGVYGSLNVRSQSDNLCRQLQLEGVSGTGLWCLTGRDNGDYFHYYATSGYVAYSIIDGGRKMAIGQVGATSQFEVNYSNSDTTPASPTPYGAMGVTNYDATSDNYSALYFGDSSGAPDSAVIGIHKDHAAHTGDLEFWNKAAGTFARSMLIASNKQVTMDAYGAGVCHFSSAGLISSSAVVLTSEVSGLLPIANGGTGQATANAALNALLPSQASSNGKFLTTDGTNTSWATVTGGGGGSTEACVYQHADNCVWAVANEGTYIFPNSGDATCTFTQKVDAGCGTVTSALIASDNGPGIIYTPSSAGNYLVCATVGNQGNTTNQCNMNILYDGSTEIAAGYFCEPTGASATSASITMCGIDEAPSTSPRTIQVRYQTFGTGTPQVNTGGNGIDVRSITWTLQRQ